MVRLMKIMLNSKTTTIKSFEYKRKKIEKTRINNKAINAKIVVLLKYLSNFSRDLNLPLISCGIELD